MITLTLAPLTDDYRVVTCRVTEIESAIFPPMYISHGDKREEIFKDGHTLGTIVQSYLMNKSTLPTLVHLFGNQLSEYERLPKICDMTFEDTGEALSDIECISVSNKFFLRIEYGKYLIILSGENDCICYSQARECYYMSDVKFVKARRKNLDEKLQKNLYPLMFCLTSGIQDEMDFEYRMFIKNKKKPVLQRLKHRFVMDEFMEILPSILDDYIRKNDDKFISSDDYRGLVSNQELGYEDNGEYDGLLTGGGDFTFSGAQQKNEQHGTSSSGRVSKKVGIY